MGNARTSLDRRDGDDGDARGAREEGKHRPHGHRGQPQARVRGAECVEDPRASKIRSLGVVRSSSVKTVNLLFWLKLPLPGCLALARIAFALFLSGGVVVAHQDRPN